MSNPTWDETVPTWDDTLPEDEAGKDDRGLFKKGWDALAVPEQMSRQGLQSLAQMVPEPEPTGNLPIDLIKGAPRILANTMAEAAPGFVSRGTILTAGAAKVAKGMAPIANAAGRGLATQMESLTGAKPGSVSAAFNDATTIFSKGRKAVGKGYENIEDAGMSLDEQLKASPIFGGPPKSNLQIVRQASKMAEKGTLSSGEAFEARKAADALKGSKAVNQTQLMRDRAAFDQIAKTDEAIASTDPQFKKAVYGESLRQLFPQNKYGGTSAFKTGIITALQQMGGLGKVAGAVMSPAAVGSLATATGIASRAAAPIVTNPQAAVSTRLLLEEYLRRKAQETR